MTKKTNILITRSKDESGNEFDVFAEYGAEIIYFPTIETKIIDLSDNFKQKLNDYKNYNFVIFTSANAAKYFAEIVQVKSEDLRNVKIAAVGRKTASAVEAAGFKTEIIPEKSTAEGLLRKLERYDLRNKKILLPASELSRDYLSAELNKKGAIVDFITIYTTTINTNIDMRIFNSIKENKPEYFIFTSPSSFTNYLKIFRIEDASKYFHNRKVIPIGPVTDETLKINGIKSEFIPADYSVKGIVKSLLEYFEQKGPNEIR